jgi:hypothetical protein
MSSPVGAAVRASVRALLFLTVFGVAVPAQGGTPKPAASDAPKPAAADASKPAQSEAAKKESDLHRSAAGILASFAGTAQTQKVGHRAKQAYDLILSAYDTNNQTARTALGFKKEKDQWVPLPPDKRKKWLDKANYEGRFKVMDEWYKTAVKLGALHREVGLLYRKEQNDGKATEHLQKAVYYNANDREANLALGFKEAKGWFGTDEQLAFAARMKEIETKAVELARKTDYKVDALPLDQMPVELQNLQREVPGFMKTPDINIFGAKSQHFTVWTRGTQENADDAVRWAERAIDFGVWLLGEKEAKRLHFVENASQPFAWRGFLFTVREREELLKANQPIWEGAKNVEEAMRFSNTAWHIKEGIAEVSVAASPRHVHDTMIANVFMYGLCSGHNNGIGQGIVHAATWYLKSTSISRWGALPEGSVGDDALKLPDTTNWWLRAVRDQASSTQDYPLAQVPREKLSRFRNDCRLKTWSFMTWAMAQYPDKWLKFFLKMPDTEKSVPTLEDVEAVIVKELGEPSEAIDEKWREWARGDSGVAFGTGYGPPLLPERPSAIELAAVERINLIRAQPIAFTWQKGQGPDDGTLSGMPECEMDAEASFACDAHASYVNNHRELAEKPGPEIHEEDPANEDFTRRGQLAGNGNIITVNASRGAEFARDTVDGWIGTPYHRFPMLEHNIKRLGYAFLSDTGFTVAVLDMNSLEEPYDPQVAPKFVVWPPPGSVGIPTTFSGRESPNPLADQPQDQQDITKCGYPISLQLQHEEALKIVDSDIQLFESHKGGKPPQKKNGQPIYVVDESQQAWKDWTDRCKKEPVAIWVHTPKVPLNKKEDLRDVIFCLPKESLEKSKTYQVRVKMQQTDKPYWFIWEFTTGNHADGLQLK